jgi:ribosome biogenesis GTPase
LEIRCSLRGKFKKEFEFKGDKLYSIDIAAVGDNVEYEMSMDGTGVISEIFPRRNHISRKAPKIKGVSTRGERLEQIIACNIDNLIIVSSWNKPKFNNRLIDRLIVAGESSHINIIIVINKIDLDKLNEVMFWSQLYRIINYTVIETSVVNSAGLDKLTSLLNGKVNLFWGQSGVGKSSLLNEIYPTLNLKVGEISNFSSKGKHTTVTSLMKKVDKDTYIIDTPGMREIDPYGIRKEDLGHYFVEFSKFQSECKFNTCTHHHEPNCAVINAVENGLINSERYKSYLNILESIESDMNF